MPSGTYQLYLYMPDAYSRLASDPAYSVRMANTGVWESATGMNNLGATVTVSAGQTPPEPEDDAVALPAVLNKANVNAYSDDMTWYNTDYFDFGPEDGLNTGRWAEWKVALKYPGKYFVAVTGWYPNGHQWQISLPGSGAAAYELPASWDSGQVTENGEAKWDLSNLAAGTYTLRMQNIMEWGQPKLLNISLQYDGVLPSGVQDITTHATDNRAYDILGRPVDSRYHGLVIINGQKIIR